MLSDTGLVAVVSALHLAGAMVRRHRASGTSLFSPFVVPSFAFVGVPWIAASPIGLVIGVIAHAIWFACCEQLAPRATPRPARVPSDARRPAAAAPRPKPSAPPKSAAPKPGFVSLPVLAVLDEAKDIKTFRVARPADFSFAPGQFVPVRVQVDGKPQVRCYSISSSPGTLGYFEISVRRQGLVSTLLHASIRTGSHLSVNRPAGQFVYPDADDRPLALLAGGIGITPLLAMLRHAIAADPGRPISLLYSARDRDSLAFLNELRVIAERHPLVRIGITLSNDTAAQSRWRQGRIDLAMIRQFVPHPQHSVFCVCGPDAMMTSAQSLLEAEGVPRDQIRSEHFATALAAASLNPSAADKAPAQVGASNRAADGFRLRFASSDRDALVCRTQTLLDAADTEGIAITSSCRSGVCQSCRTRLIEGDADCQSSVLDADDRAAGYVLPCVTYALGDCVLEA